MKQIIYGIVPSKSNGYKPIEKGMVKKQHIKEYERIFAIQYRLIQPMIKGKFALVMDVYFPSEAHDLDGALKIVLDMLQKIGAVKNDNKNYKLIIDKYIDKANPRIELEIYELAVQQNTGAST